MKLFYFGSVCANSVFNETVQKSKVKPSASAQTFENALVKGLVENGCDLTVVSAESIATYPRGNRLLLKPRQDELQAGCKASILPAVNLPLLKQLGHANGARKQLLKWLEANRIEEKCVLVYGIYPPVVKQLQKLCKHYGCKIFAVITDVPSTMFTYTKPKSMLKRLFSGSYRNAAIAVQDGFDGYVFLTEAMSEVVAPGKPFTIVETIADITAFDGIPQTEKASPPVLMYAGSLYRKYGVDRIVDALSYVHCDCQLWLFGSGDYEQTILEKAGKDSRIHFFGRVSRKEILQREKEATLLLNIRSAGDEYTKYSFPSKMVEYMLSGTPLLTTKLAGIPEEYDSYCYVTESEAPEQIGHKISAILHDPNAPQMGIGARRFVQEHKSSSIQAARVLAFMKENL